MVRVERAGSGAHEHEWGRRGTQGGAGQGAFTQVREGSHARPAVHGGADAAGMLGQRVKPGASRGKPGGHVDRWQTRWETSCFR